MQYVSVPVYSKSEYCRLGASVVNEARGVKARDMQGQGHRPKAKNANVNCRENAIVNLNFESFLLFSRKKNYNKIMMVR